MCHNVFFSFISLIVEMADSQDLFEFFLENIPDDRGYSSSLEVCIGDSEVGDAILVSDSDSEVGDAILVPDSDSEVGDAILVSDSDSEVQDTILISDSDSEVEDDDSVVNLENVVYADFVRMFQALTVLLNTRSCSPRNMTKKQLGTDDEEY